MNKLPVPQLWTTETGAAVAKQVELAANAYSTDQTLEEMRLAYNKERRYWNEGGPKMVATRDAMVPTRHGNVKVRMFRPVEADKLPAIFFSHGGGWILGNLDTHDRMTRILAEQTGAAVIAIDYTLSPEARYPRHIEECVDVGLEIRKKALEWGIDSSDVSYAGDSGGASIALASYLYMRQEHGNADGIRSLLLFYGWYGLRDSISSRILGGEWDGLTEKDFDTYKQMYFSSPEDARAPYVDLLSQDLTQEMPATYICAAGLDPLRDDSICLAKIMEAAKNPHKLEVFDGIIHAFLHHTKMVPQANEAIASAAAFFKKQKPGLYPVA